ncbi:MAG: glycine cleavage system protein GcvH [Vulcanimicrobiaceae bacterium]
MANPADLLYSKEHEWVKFDGDVATVGITNYAQESLGDIVYVEAPKIGAKVEQFANAGVVESVKAVSDLFSPVGGEVLEINRAIDSDPGVVNREPYSGGWLFKVKVANGDAQKGRLLSVQAYESLVQQ